VVVAQLMLDPFYRTMEGFACLVEKDFSSFGHPFHTRCAHGEGTGGSGGGQSASNAVVGGGAGGQDEGQRSPIFLQFLDCVYQIVNQYPDCFEYNTKYLLVVSEHVYSCRFGNFLCDTERERELVAGIRQRTHSLWDYLDEREDVKNHGYDAMQGGGTLLMPLPMLLRNVSLWTDRHCMYASKATSRSVVDTGVPSIRVKSSYDTDQQSPLITDQEAKAWIAQCTVLQQPPSLFSIGNEDDGDQGDCDANGDEGDAKVFNESTLGEMVAN